MAYFLGRDVKVAISTEHASKGFTNSSGDAAYATDDGSGVPDLTGIDIGAGTGAVTDITGVEVSMGAVDEDISYMGQRTALKAEIKKDTSVTITRKKSDRFWSEMWALNYRWGGDSAAHAGNTQPDSTHGFRLHVAVKDLQEVISIPGCTLSEYAQTLSADGVTEETLTFVSSITPAVGASEDTTNLIGSTTFPL
jgi:hypothetical protein